MDVPKSLSRFAEVLIDSYFIIDRDFNIIDFNRAFHSMLPRPVARKLKTKKCYEVLQLEICKQSCIARKCWESGSAVRLDEISGCVAGSDEQMKFILGAVSVYDDQGNVIGAMEMQRNVTDEALVQAKYQQQMDASAQRQRKLEDDLRLRTRRLLDVGQRLHAAQRELVRMKTELFG